MEKNTKLFFDPSVRKLIESFSYCFDIKITFYSPSLDEWLVGYHTTASDFCTLMQQTLHVRYRCLHQDALMCAKCGRVHKRIVYRCHAGLYEAVIPIFMQGELVAYCVAGQFRMHEGVSDILRREWVRNGFEFSVLEKAFLDRPLFSQEKLDHMLFLLEEYIGYFTSTEAMKLRKPELVEAVVQYIESHIGDAISLEEVAEELSKSGSTITHAVKNSLGMSFKELLISQKLMSFERLISHEPDMPIFEAAEKVGYSDALYFSRIYRKYRGMPPSDYVDSVHRSLALSGTGGRDKD